MNIAIIEKGHFEVVYTLISLFDTGDNRLTIFIDKPSYVQLEYLLKEKIVKHTWIIQDKQSNRVFIKHMFHHIQSHSFDLLYFNTIADNFIYYAYYIKRLANEKVILTLHDILGYFRYVPAFSLRKLIRFVGKRKMIHAVQNLNVISETLIPLLQKKISTSHRIFNISGGFFEPEKFIKQSYNKGDFIKITVPGSIDSRRRNYNSLFELLEAARLQRSNISVTLLGTFRKQDNKEIYDLCHRYIRSSNNLHFYETDSVDQEEFDRIMKETHFIWIPVRQFAIVTDGAREEYGVTITSGNIGDVIRHCRPFFSPHYFKIDKTLESGCLRYANTKDILNALRELNSTSYSQLQDGAYYASMNYTKEKIVSRNNELFG